MRSVCCELLEILPSRQCQTNSHRCVKDTLLLHKNLHSSSRAQAFTTFLVASHCASSRHQPIRWLHKHPGWHSRTSCDLLLPRDCRSRYARSACVCQQMLHLNYDYTAASQTIHHCSLSFAQINKKPAYAGRDAEMFAHLVKRGKTSNGLTPSARNDCFLLPAATRCHTLPLPFVKHRWQTLAKHQQ